MLKIAYCVKPHTGGTYTVYLRLREGLAKHNIELRWVALVHHGFSLTPEFEDEIHCGELIYLQETEQKSAKNFINHIESNYNGVIINVLADPIQTNAARYISNHILKLQIVHNITPATYRAACSIKNHVHAIITISPRMSRDLISQIKFSATKVYTILHAVNQAAFQQVRSKRHPDEKLKLLYLGRIENNAKGVLWLPDILQACLELGIEISLTVAGDGADLAKLKLKTSRMNLEQYINFYGKVNYADVPQLMAEHHIFVMPSRYEGFGYTLIEAMASGCVPVCSKINGVTDFIVSHDKNGYLFPVGNVKKAAQFISKLQDENVWQHFSQNALAASQERFSLSEQAESYAKLIHNLRQNPPEIASPISLDNWYLPSGLRPSLSVYIPNSVKNILRVWRERIAYR